MLDPGRALEAMLVIGLLLGIAIYGVPTAIAVWNLLP